MTEEKLQKVAGKGAHSAQTMEQRCVNLAVMYMYLYLMHEDQQHVDESVYAGSAACL